MPEQHCLPTLTDTAYPVTPVPVFYLHAPPQHFCRHPRCLCHCNEAQLKSLLLQVIDGELVLRNTPDGSLVTDEVEHL